MIFILFSFLLIYFLTIGLLIYGYSKIKPFQTIGLKPINKFTIIVPFRNEADNLPILLNSFSKLNYPTDLFEVLLVDDDSDFRFQISDFKSNREQTSEALKISLIDTIRVSNSPKKDAILTAINFVTTNWIITTDADCTVNENWLLCLDNYIQNHKVSMIVAEVTYNSNASFLHHFQQLDLASLQGATVGSFGLGKGFMCNGANFAYTKTLFEALHGFDGNDSIASGDDVFLLQKAIARFPEEVHYLKSENTIVTTKPLNNWKSLFYQRVRWASKTGSYQSFFGKALAVIVLAGNMSIILSLVFCLLGELTWQDFAFLFLVKFIIDTTLLYKTNNHLIKQHFIFLILTSLFYPFFCVAVALFSFFGKYEWKGRVFK